MNLTTLRGDIRFWDAFAPWYEKWLSRGEYHQPIIREVAGMVEPGWAVLDIGAATGVLSIPIAALGCTVEAVEPSAGMRQIFVEKINSLRIKNINICGDRWETYGLDGSQRFDLVIACNSLHLTGGGLKRGMLKVFSTGAVYICLVTEINQSIFIDFKEIDALGKDYTLLYIKNYKVNSSFIFKDLDEVERLSELLGQEMPVERTGDQLIQHDSTDIAVVWWEKVRTCRQG